MSPVTSVPLLDLTRFDSEYEAEMNATFARVLKSGMYVMGPELVSLEAECAKSIGVKHALGVSSGTDALILALMTLDIGPGDEVICPSFTFFATAGSIWRLGAKPIFVDSSLKDFNALPAAVEAAVTKKTKAIMPVHLFGQCAEMDPLLAIAQKAGVPLVEDDAQAIGATYKNKQAGSLGTFGCFSFFPTKNLGALGDGGLVTTNDDALAAKAKIMRVHGGEPKYFHSMVGGNFRLDALQAALLRIKLRRLDSAHQKRQKNAAQYVSLFKDAKIAEANEGQKSSNAPLLYPLQTQSNHTYNQFVVRVMGKKRDDLRKFLADRKVGTEIYYPVPLHSQTCFAALGHKAGAFPNAETLAEEVLALPIFPELREDEISYAVESITKFFR